MTYTATGTFDVKVLPVVEDEKIQIPNLGRHTLDKQFHGDIEGTSKGQMLSAMTEVKGSAGAVAIERVEGKLKGLAGSFVLAHIGVMSRGTPQYWNITVVPDSGTGELVGLSGSMKIIIEGGKHSYELTYELAEKK